MGPGSVRKEGYPWMKMDFSEAVENGYIKPLSELSMSSEEEIDYGRGLVYEKVPEILTKCHVISPSSPSVGRAVRYCPSCWLREN